ncbi:MAG: hypothetical protein L0H26_00130 [Microlunatus sp.]|nr:hypothetical protein [Microlunatus sp.]
MPAALEQATVVIEAVLTGYATETGEYAANLRAALRAESVGARQLGLVCSTVSAHQRLQAQTANPEPEWEWLGSVGEKVTITGTVRAALRLPGYTHYSRDQVLLVITSGTTLAKTITSAAWAYDVRAGDQITVTATVKALQTYRGDRQTVLRAPRIPRTTATTAKKEH